MPGAEAIARRNVRLWYLFLFLMDFGLWFGIWIKYLTVTRELELKYVLLMDMPFWLLVATLEAPFGALADRIGRRRVLAIGAFTMSVTVLGFGFTTNYWLLFFDYALWAFAMAARSGADQALVYESLKDAGTSERFSKIAGRGFAITLTAGVAGILFGGVVAESTSLPFVVQISALGPFLAGFVALAMTEPTLIATGKHYLEDLRDGIAFTWNSPQVRWSVLLLAALLGASFAPVVLMQPFLIEFDVPTSLFGLYQAPLRIISVLGAVFAFRIATKASVPRLLTIGSAFMVIAYAGLAIVDVVGAFAFFTMPALVQGLIRPTMDAYINDRTPSEKRATVLSVASLCLSVQLAFFEPAIGFVADDISIQAAAGVTAIVFALVLPPLLLAWKRHDGPPEIEPGLAQAATVPGG